MARLVRKGLGLHTETHGQGSPVLLTHGYGATCRMWDEQIEAFTDRFRLIVWDLPGHGQSDPPDDRVSPASVADIMRAILDKAGAERAVVGGLGLGASLSLRFWRAWPDRVRGLILIGAMPGLRGGTARALWNARAMAQAGALERDGLDALEGGAEADPRMHADAAALAGAARRLLPRNDSEMLPDLAAVATPTLILVGGEDKPNLSAAAHMARVMPNARLEVVPRANHAVTLHKPGAANAAIQGFLSRLPP